MESRDYNAALAPLNAAISALDDASGDWCPLFRSDALAVLLAERAEAHIQSKQPKNAVSDAERAIATCRTYHLGWERTQAARL
jgi:hypothetical protein